MPQVANSLYYAGKSHSLSQNSYIVHVFFPVYKRFTRGIFRFEDDFVRVADDIDRAKKAYEERCATNAENAKNGGRPKKRPVSEKPDGLEKTDGFLENRTVFEETEKTQTKDKTKGKSKSKENKDLRPEPPPEGGAAGRGTVVSLPLNDKSLYHVSHDQVEHWKELFPAVAIEQELRSMVAWCEANPQKRKTRGGVEKFIIAWLTKRQDRGGTFGFSQQGLGAVIGPPRAAAPDYGDKEEYL